MSDTIEKTRGAENYQLIKLVIIGDSGVGKSSLLLRLTDDSFTESFINTIGVDFRFKTVHLNGNTIKLQIWDTAGQERFRTITSAYYRGANGIILVYDTTDRNSFNHIDVWMVEINKYTDKNTLKILIGNKTDLSEEKEVSTEMGMAKATELGMNFFEASAKNANNVEKAFYSLASMIVQSRQSQNKDSSTKSQINIPQPDLRENVTSRNCLC